MEKNKGTLNVITNTIIKYKKEFENIDFKLCTSDGKQIIIRFSLDDFLRYSGLDKFNIKDKLKKVNSKEEIMNYISLGIVMNLNSIEKTDISNSCNIFLNVAQLDLGIVHSIIELEDKLYMVLKTGRGRPVLELAKSSYDEEKSVTTYNVIDIKKTSYLSELIKSKKASVSFPVTSNYRDKDNIFISYRLSDEYQKERMLDFKELLYVDKKGEVRDINSNPGYEEYLKRTPIIK